MQVISVPNDVKHHSQIKAGEISFVQYHDKGSLIRNNVVFNQYAISFILDGQKEIYLAEQNTVLYTGQAMLIPQGNSIIMEHNPNGDLYSSFIVFFPGDLITDFLAKHPQTLIALDKQRDAPPYIYFASTPYLNEYIKGFQALINSSHQLSYAIALHKLEELLLAIYEIFPMPLINIFRHHQDNYQLSLKSIVENNLFSNLTLEELAFLANRSRSTFKRDFEKSYGLSPQKYIRERKLEAACTELVKGKQASEIYNQYGYENLSNFNTAFKKKFGLTPASYQQNLAV